jgi:hypothetical protein
MASCKVQFFSAQRPTNCQGSMPFPEFALFTTLLRRVRLSQSGQWLADIMIVAPLCYNHGKRQGISGSSDSAGVGQVGGKRPRSRNFQRRTDSGLYQKVAESARFGGIEPHSTGLRSPCIPTLMLHIQRGTYSPSNSPKVNRSGIRLLITPHSKNGGRRR